MEKELKQQIETLENTNADQAGKITALEKTVEGLQSEIQALSSEISCLNQKSHQH